MAKVIRKLDTFLEQVLFSQRNVQVTLEGIDHFPNAIDPARGMTTFIYAAEQSWGQRRYVSPGECRQIDTLSEYLVVR